MGSGELVACFILVFLMCLIKPCFYSRESKQSIHHYQILQSIDYTSIHSSDSNIDDNAKFCCTCIEKSHHTCITSYFQAWKSPQCPLTDPSLIRQPHPSVGHIMGTRLTPQAIRLTPRATQRTHPWETCLIHQTMLPTLTSKMCRMQPVLYRQQADMF